MAIIKCIFLMIATLLLDSAWLSRFKSRWSTTSRRSLDCYPLTQGIPFETYSLKKLDSVAGLCDALQRCATQEGGAFSLRIGLAKADRSEGFLMSNLGQRLPFGTLGPFDRPIWPGPVCLDPLSSPIIFRCLGFIIWPIDGVFVGVGS